MIDTDENTSALDVPAEYTFLLPSSALTSLSLNKPLLWHAHIVWPFRFARFFKKHQEQNHSPHPLRVNIPETTYTTIMKDVQGGYPSYLNNNPYCECALLNVLVMLQRPTGLIEPLPPPSAYSSPILVRSFSAYFYLS